VATILQRKQTKIATIAVEAVRATISEFPGITGGTLYCAMVKSGFTLPQFQSITDKLVEWKLIERRDGAYFPRVK